MRQGFIPDRRNLGGKADIDNLQKNHLLALINAKSVTHNLVSPYQPVAHQKKNRQKSLGQIQIEFREVYEAKKKVLQLKKGGIDMSKPVCFDRKQFIKNRACTAKDIETQDHQRNLVSLSKRLTGVDLKSEKNKQKMKEDQQKQQSLQSKYCSRHDHSLFSNGVEAYNLINRRPQSANINKLVKGYGSLRQSIDYTEGQNKSANFKVNYAYKNKQQDSYNQQRSMSNVNLGSMDYSQMVILDDQPNQSQSHPYLGLNHKKNYIDSKVDFLVSGVSSKIDMDYYIKENYGTVDDEDVEYIYQKNQSDNSIQQSEVYSAIQPPQSRYNNLSKNYHNQSQNQQQQQQQNQQQQEVPKPIQQSIPFIISNGSTDPYTELRRSLLNVIMDYKLYDKQQMMDLAQLVKKKNPHLDFQHIQGVCKHIILRLYGEF